MANFILDQSYDVTEDSSLRIGTTNGTGEVKEAESFIPTVSAPITKISVKLAKNGSPVGNVYMTIEADSSGSPSGSALATSNNQDASALGTTAAYVDFTFATPFYAVGGTTYWYVLQGTYAQSDVNNTKTYGTAAAGYSRGVGKTYNGTSWSAALSLDLNFKEYNGGGGGAFLLHFA